MTTIALISWGKDSIYSAYEAQRSWKKIDQGFCFMNKQEYVLLDTWPQTWGNLIDFLFQSLDFPISKISTIEERNSKEIFDKICQEILNTVWWNIEIILWELRDNEYSTELKYRLPNATFYNGYRLCKSPKEYLNKLSKTVPNIIISWTKIESLAGFVWKRFDKDSISDMLKLWFSYEQILWEDDEVQTLVLPELHNDLLKNYKVRKIVSNINNVAYWILQDCR